MSDDYIWDKTGEDAEIERLEQVLSVFKYEQTAAPRPAVLVLPERKRGWTFGLRLAFAAGFAAFLIAGAAFILRPDTENAAVDEVASPQAPKLIQQQIIEAPESTEPKAGIPVDKYRAEKIVLKHSVPVRHSRKASEHRKPAQNPVPRLTADEKHAYNQLMLALSITGSKLKVVKDAVNGTDDVKNVSDTSSK